MIRFMNSAMMPQPGVYRAFRLDKDAWLDKVRGWLELGVRWQSYIGYEQNARMLSVLLGVDMPVSREETTVEDGDVLAVMTLKYRVQDPANKGRKVDPGDFDWWIVYYYNPPEYTSASSLPLF